MMGIFSSIEGKENMNLKQFAEINAPALMLPYIRELVTTTTVRAGLRPISFPPINVIALLKEKSKANFCSFITAFRSFSLRGFHLSPK